MRQVLAVEGVVYRALRIWVLLVGAGLTWLLFSLPIVTAPAATAVLVVTVAEIRQGEDLPPLSASWRQLCRHFWPALRLAALVALGHGLIVSATLGPSPRGPWEDILPMIIVPVAVTWLLATQWVFPALLERRDGAIAALRRSYLRAMRRPDLAFASGCGGLVLLLVGVLLPNVVMIPYWLTVPALWALLTRTTDQRAGGARSSTGSYRLNLAQ